MRLNKPSKECLLYKYLSYLRWNGVLKVQNHIMHSQITYSYSIWQEKDWIVTRFRKLLYWKYPPEKREEENNAMINQQRYLLGLQVFWLFPNRHWHPRQHRLYSRHRYHHCELLFISSYGSQRTQCVWSSTCWFIWTIYDSSVCRWGWLRSS